MANYTRRTLMKSSAAAALGASVSGLASGNPDDPDTASAPSVRGDLKRFSTTALGAEVTGPFVLADGTPLCSLQHPSRENQPPYDRAGIGVMQDFQFELEGTNDDFEELSVPRSDAERKRVRTSESEFELFAREADPINGGTERLGVAQTPDGVDVTTENFPGSTYGASGFNPDSNQFVRTDGQGTEGLLFTNFENSPGAIARIPLRKEGGEWTADLEAAINVTNTEPFRAIGGTRINCYGDLSPWNTVVSSEEHYGHTRVSLTATVGDVVEKGTGKGLRAANGFWNRPDPSGIQDAVSEHYGNDSWYVQGYWNIVGVEHLAYYLGADPVDRDGDANEPIGDVYPNPYRYGYHVDIREPAADPPKPVKYYVMGRAAWEAPDFQSDMRTVYGCSDGDSKGVYKFVADRPIPSYRDPMDLSGTLYAPKVTNPEAARNNSPADVDLEIEWLELGTATNREVESWIAEYDGITQVDYLETHAATDWRDDFETALEEADREVVRNGNLDYVTDEQIVEWARQYEESGPDGVDEELRRVPFLETRAAAKEIGASIEFNKAEGVDSVDGATPGDYVYFGISEFNDDLSNDVGDLQMQRVDGGVVYRAQLEPDYDVSTLEPVIVGADASDPADVADDALINVDNVYVMDDGRVLCCEDADQLGRSYSNDGLYVYEPEDHGPTPNEPPGPPFPDRDGDGDPDPTRREFEEAFPGLEWESWKGLFENDD
jgi:secreted PhoX family phosphatase